MTHDTDSTDTDSTDTDTTDTERTADGPAAWLFEVAHCGGAWRTTVCQDHPRERYADEPGIEVRHVRPLFDPDDCQRAAGHAQALSGLADGLDPALSRDEQQTLDDAAAYLRAIADAAGCDDEFRTAGTDTPLTDGGQSSGGADRLKDGIEGVAEGSGRDRDASDRSQRVPKESVEMTDQTIAEREGSPWYCRRCTHWVGYKRSQCSCGRDRPRFPVLSKYVDVEHAGRVTFTDRLRAVWRLIRADGGGR